MGPHKLIFLIAFIVSVREFTEAQLYSYSEPTCNTEQCRFLLDKLVLQSTPGEPCKDFQKKVCSWRNDYDGHDLIKRDPDIIRFENAVEKNLTEKLVNRYNGDLRSIYLEKDLYQQCQKLGFPDGRNVENSERIWSISKRFSDIVDLAQAIGVDNWKKIDQLLYELGVGYAFFDVKVVQDPKNMSKNIILIESPSAAALDATRKMLFTQYSKIENIFNVNARNLNEPIDSFFDSWVEAANKTTESSFVQFPNTRMTLEEWDDKFNNRYDEHYVVNINWVPLITQIFRQVNITIDQYTPIIVKNERTYFEKLYYLLRDTPNDIIAATILYKAVAENWRYVDRRLVQSLNDVEKHSFCFNDIKLYGISYRFFHDTTSTNEVNMDHYKKLKYIVYNIIQSIRHQVRHSSLSFINEVYFLDELDSIVAGVFTDIETNEYLTYIADYYGDFEISDDYFDSIVNYRKILKNKELSSLKNNPKKELRPFSVTDSRLPSNRFLLYICYILHEMANSALPENLPKEYYYGTYGTKIASFIYALLSENKFENTEVNYAEKSSKEMLTTRPEYTREILLCQQIAPNKTMKEYASEKITEKFGMQIAYEAMKLDISFKTDKDLEKDTFPQNTEFNVNHYFFLSYAASHCQKYEEIINSVLSTEDFVHVFNCNNKTRHFTDYQNECKLKMFDAFNNRALLIQL